MPSLNQLSPTGHSFGRPPLLAAENSIALHSFTGSQTFQPLPPATGGYPYRLNLGDVIGADPVNAIVTAGSMTFHVMGDTGGVAQPAPQQIVAQKLDADVAQPAFLYLLGDCIYYNGELSQYPQQFYEPYAHYPAPIFAVPVTTMATRCPAGPRWMASWPISARPAPRCPARHRARGGRP